MAGSMGDMYIVTTSPPPSGVLGFHFVIVSFLLSSLFFLLGRGRLGRPLPVGVGSALCGPFPGGVGPPWPVPAPSLLLLGSPVQATPVVGASLPFLPWGVGGLFGARTLVS